jgi:hypothetical protein
MRGELTIVRDGRVDWLSTDLGSSA